MTQRPKRIFLLSPANASGIRAQHILREQAEFELAVRMREAGAHLGEIFAFISGLYFRGKLAYARAFAEPPENAPGILVITASRGLMSPDAVLTLDDLREIASVPIHEEDERYRNPLERDAQQLMRQIGDACEVVLLGSIATPKYVEPLLGIFGDALLFPSEFVGRGDMSRGGLMLRSAREGVPLSYAPVKNSVRRGSRPPKLPKLRVAKAP
jgi:hypothetical protein